MKLHYETVSPLLVEYLKTIFQSEIFKGMYQSPLVC